MAKIKVMNSAESELKLFLKFLHHDFHKQQRNIILSSFPELQSKITNNPDLSEESVVGDFINDFYQSNSEKIKLIITKDEQLLDARGDDVLSALRTLMDADWPQDKVFYAVPTILPFSPFENDTFFYSILGEIKTGRSSKNILFFAAHEISHFVFYDALKKMTDIQNTLSKESEHYLKEALAVAILNENPLKEILKIENYSGNPELNGLNLSIDGKVIGFTSFISDYYHEHKIANKEKFGDVLFSLINILSAADKDLILKKDIWNKYGLKLNQNPSAISEYFEPMKIKGHL
ncbi:MAG: hypothetical protein PHP35_00010 [Candidatus Colwellbacteria bacterium]|nr:hypothetical protein [Candidatus Colwellbacteria bacterium]